MNSRIKTMVVVHSDLHPTKKELAKQGCVVRVTAPCTTRNRLGRVVPGYVISYEVI